MQAQFDCGIGESDALRIYIEEKIRLEQWPYVAGDISCLTEYLPQSYSAILRSGAVSGLAITSLSLITAILV